MPQTAVSGDDAAEYADLVSMISDLERVIELSHALRRQVAQDKVTASALWESAVIAYGRCFTNGRSALGKRHRRKMPSEALKVFGPDLRRAHDEVMELRNQHVGHRVGEASAVRVIAFHEYVGGPPVGVGHLQLHMVLPDSHVELPKLAHSLLGYLKPLAERELQALTVRVQAAFGAAGNGGTPGASATAAPSQSPPPGPVRGMGKVPFLPSGHQ